MTWTLFPDLTSDLAQLLTLDLSQVDRVGLYAEQVYADSPNQFAQPTLPNGVGVNCWPYLQPILGSIQKPLTLEVPVVKDWRDPSNPNPLNGLDGVETARLTGLAIRRMVSTIMWLPLLTMDEPYTSAKGASVPDATCWESIQRWADILLAEWPDLTFEFTEAFPEFRQDKILPWTDQLRGFLGDKLVGLRLDVDFNALHDPQHHDRLDLRACRYQCESWKLPLSVIVWPGGGTFSTGDAWVAKAWDTLTSPDHGIHELLQQAWPDALCVQSWDGRDRPPLPQLLDLVNRGKQFVEVHP